MKITLGTFKDNADELAAFLQPRLGAEPLVSGGEMIFDDDKVKKTVKARHVKTYIKRYLNRKGERANYKILVNGQELRLIEIERDEEEKEEKKASKPELKEPKKEEAKEAGQKEDKVVEKEEEGARGDMKAEEKKEGALDKETTKEQTKPKRNSAD